MANVMHSRQIKNERGGLTTLTHVFQRREHAGENISLIAEVVLKI